MSPTSAFISRDANCRDSGGLQESSWTRLLHLVFTSKNLHDDGPDALQDLQTSYTTDRRHEVESWGKGLVNHNNISQETLLDHN